MTTSTCRLEVRLAFCPPSRTSKPASTSNTPSHSPKTTLRKHAPSNHHHPPRFRTPGMTVRRAAVWTDSTMRASDVPERPLKAAMTPRGASRNVFPVVLLSILLIITTLSFTMIVQYASFDFFLTPIDPTFNHKLCLIYDKPKRTGSTTISRALHRCWSSTYGVEPHVGESNASAGTARMLSLNQTVVAHSLRHIYFSDDDCASIDARCRQYFHVTSTRSMGARIASYGKVVALQKTLGRNFTATSTSDSLRKIVYHMVKRGKRLEFAYERGAFKGVRKLRNDYIIRNHRLQSDLDDLLRAFDCPPLTHSTNTHTVAVNASASASADDSDSDAPFDDDAHTDPAGSEVDVTYPSARQVDRMSEAELAHWFTHFPLRYGDRLHRSMLREADRVNARGLRTVRALLPLLLPLRAQRESSWAACARTGRTVSMWSYAGAKGSIVAVLRGGFFFIALVHESDWRLGRWCH